MSPGYSSLGSVRSISTHTYGFILVALKAGLYVDVFRCLDSKTNAVAADFQDRDFDLVSDDDLLVLFAANNEHGDELLPFSRS